MKIVIFRNIYHNLYYTQNNQILSFKYEKNCNKWYKIKIVSLLPFPFLQPLMSV